MHRVLVSSFFIACFFAVVSTVYGVSSDFIIRTFVGQDITPPTIPAPVTATPITTTQIDLVWGASTDDYSLSGYQVFRDVIQIATTTLTTYSDVGLTPSTTYAYFIRAFDSFNNVSTSSSIVATTTFATASPPVTPTTTTPANGTTYGSKIRLPELVSIEVIPSQYGARIRYETKGPVKSITRWGTSISYELGSSAERAFSKFHEISISDLRPGTHYRFSIEGENHMGRFGILTESSFVTLPGNDTTPPGIVTGLTALRTGDDIVLSWQNPRDPDFDHVRVVRNTTFYPSDEADGWVVYDGDKTNARDTLVLTPGIRLFYSVFTYDTNGNISSAAVVALRIPKNGDGAEFVDVTDETKNEIGLTMDDIDFYQNERVLAKDRGTVMIDGSHYLTIAVPYEALPPHLKTILVSITPRTDTEKVLQFILRVNDTRTAYTARLAPLGVAGDFIIRVSVFDFKTAQIGHTHGRITSTITDGARDENLSPSGEPSYIATMTAFIVRNYILLFILCLLLVAFFTRQLLQERKK